jgi:hypothetical protein
VFLLPGALALETHRSSSAGLIVAVLCALGISALAIFYLARGRGPLIEDDLEGAEFIARFDSLTDARLYPVMWKAGVFTKTRFDERRMEWTITVTPSDWSRRDRASKLDVATRLWNAFQAARAQAGGDPSAAVLVIESGQGDELARCSEDQGTCILK